MTIMSIRTVAFGAIGCALLLPVSATIAAPVCPLVAVQALGGTGLLNPLTGIVSCIAIGGAAMTLDGQVETPTAVQAMPGTTQYFYDSAPRLTKLTDPEGNTTQYTYQSLPVPRVETSTATDTANQPVSNTQYMYNATFTLIDRVQYDGNGNSAADRRERFQYDDTSTPLPTVTRTEYDTSGQPMHTTRYEYDYSGGRLSMVTQSEYDGDGSGPVATEFEYQYTYDATTNLVTQVTDNLGNTLRYQYDSLDRPIREYTDPTGPNQTPIDTRYFYDAQFNQVTEITDAVGGRVTRYTYDTDPQTQQRLLTSALAVPEPASLLLLAAGALGLARLRRRR